MTPIPRLRAYEGPALLSYGFRPFFLLAGLHAAIALPLWLWMHASGATPGGPFAGMQLADLGAEILLVSPRSARTSQMPLPQERDPLFRGRARLRRTDTNRMSRRAKPIGRCRAGRQTKRA